MQVGHVPLALSIATYDWNLKTVVLCLGMHFLPNFDSLVERSVAFFGRCLCGRADCAAARSA